MKYNEESYTAAQATIGGLENGVEYAIYVTALNSIGESRPSSTVTGIPEKAEIKPPKLPTLDEVRRQRRLAGQRNRLDLRGGAALNVAPEGMHNEEVFRQVFQPLNFQAGNLRMGSPPLPSSTRSGSSGILCRRIPP